MFITFQRVIFLGYLNGCALFTINITYKIIKWRFVCMSCAFIIWSRDDLFRMYTALLQYNGATIEAWKPIKKSASSFNRKLTDMPKRSTDILNKSNDSLIVDNKQDISKASRVFHRDLRKGRTICAILCALRCHLHNTIDWLAINCSNNVRSAGRLHNHAQNLTSEL